MDVFNLTASIVLDTSNYDSKIKSAALMSGTLGGKLESLGDSASDAGDEIDEVGDNAKDTNGQFTTWKATIANLASQAITTLISKVKDLGEKIIELGIDTETAFAKLETIAGTENIDALTESINQLSKKTGVSSAELADVAYNAISAGASASEAADMVEAATKLATAGFTDSSSALSVLSTVMNSYGDDAGTVTEISDSLIQVQNLGVTTIDELSGAMGKAISTASAYSVNLGNLESAYVSLTKAGISTEESTTYLNSMLNELGDSGSGVSAVLQEKTGKSFTQLMEDGYSLSDVLGILYDACDGDSTALMNLWSSAEAGKASNAIVSQGLETFNENLEAITNSSGATEDAYATMSDTMEHKISVMKTSFQELGLQIFDGLEEPLSSAITFVTDKVIPAIETLIDNFDKFAPVIAAVTAALIAYKVAMGISSIIDALTKATEGTTIAQMLLNTVLNANPLVLIATLIAAVVAALIVLWNTNDDFREAVTNAWNTIKDVATAVFGAIVTFFTETVPNAIDAMLDWFRNLPNNIKTLLNNALDKVKNWGTSLVSNAKTYAQNAINGVIEWFKQLPSQLWTQLQNAISKANTFGSNLVSNLKTYASNAISGVISYFTQLPSKIMEKLNGVKSNISSWGSNLVTQFKNIGKNIIQGIINGITSMVSSLYNSIKNALSGLVKKAKSALGISSPSKVMGEEVGRWILPGVGEAIEDSTDDLYNTAQDAVDEISDVDIPELTTTVSARTTSQTATSVLSDQIASFNANFTQLFAILQEYFPQFANMQMVTDTGALVGSIAVPMDKALGKLATAKERGR